MIDILYLAHGREEFTAETWAALKANTDWSQVSRLHVVTDGIPIGPETWVPKNYDGPLFDPDPFLDHAPCMVTFSTIKHGGPVACMLDYLASSNAWAFAKIDNDVMVPPDWLHRCLAVMRAHPELDILGIEPPDSRTANPDSGKRGPEPDRFDPEMLGIKTALDFSGYAVTTSIGGVGIFRRMAFARLPDLRPEGKYGGLTSWQLRHADCGLEIGWILPPLSVFLLDRMPTEPWASLSKRYVAEGLQRPWTNYAADVAATLAGWYVSTVARKRS